MQPVPPNMPPTVTSDRSQDTAPNWPASIPGRSMSHVRRTQIALLLAGIAGSLIIALLSTLVVLLSSNAHGVGIGGSVQTHQGQAGTAASSSAPTASTTGATSTGNNSGPGSSSSGGGGYLDCAHASGFSHALPAGAGPGFADVSFPERSVGVAQSPFTDTYQFQLINVCTDDSTVGGIRSFFAAHLPVSGWTNVATYPYHGDPTSACGDSFCWRMASSPVHYVSLEQARTAGSVALDTLRLAVTTPQLWLLADDRDRGPRAIFPRQIAPRHPCAARTQPVEIRFMMRASPPNAASYRV